jgi:hypothetical protein
MAAFLDGCRFNPTAGGTTDWTYSSAVPGYQSPAAAGVVNGTLYKYRAESADLSQWELGEGAYNTSTGVLARTTVLFNSSATGTGAGQSGAGTKINFSTIPQIAVVALKEDLLSVQEANSFTSTQQAQALTNLGLGTPLAAWTVYTPACTSSSGTIATVSATGRYKIIGKTVFLNVTVSITAAGSGAGQLLVPLPVNALSSNVQTMAGAETAIVGNTQTVSDCASLGIGRLWPALQEISKMHVSLGLADPTLGGAAAAAISDVAGIPPPRSWPDDRKQRFRSLPYDLQVYVAAHETQREKVVRRAQNIAAVARQKLAACQPPQTGSTKGVQVDDHRAQQGNADRAAGGSHQRDQGRN